MIDFVKKLFVVALKILFFQVKEVAYQCLNATMTMGTDQIQSLAEEINTAIGEDYSRSVDIHFYISLIIQSFNTK